MTPRSRRTGSLLGGAVLATALALIVIVYQAVTGGAPLLAVDRPGGAPETGPAAWYAVYFSDPGGPGAQSLRGGPDAALAEAIRQARLSVEVAIYDLDLWSLRDALLDAHRRGVAVRLVTESDNLDEDEIQALITAGIPVLGDRRQGLMHNKFVVIDRLEVWTGSMNFTINGAYRNDNHLVRLRSSRLADSYLAEFEEMFVHDQFGPGSPADTPHPALQIEGVVVEVYFSPDDGVAARLVELLRGARQSVDFLAFSFTADDLAQTMMDRGRLGVAVRGVMEARQVNSNQGTEYGRLRGAGLDVHLDGNPDNMHHKLIIIDRSIVVLGSYNFSASAERRNDENVLIVFDPAFAGHFLAEFERVYQQAQP